MTLAEASSESIKNGHCPFKSKRGYQWIRVSLRGQLIRAIPRFKWNGDSSDIYPVTDADLHDDTWELLTPEIAAGYDAYPPDPKDDDNE